MLTGQFSWTDSSDLASQLMGRGNVAFVDDSEAAFALVYAEALSEQCPGIRVSVEDEMLGLPASDDYGGPHVASKLILGKADASSEETWQSLLLGYNQPWDRARENASLTTRITNWRRRVTAAAWVD
jgi:hypothetical protein